MEKLKKRVVLLLLVFSLANVQAQQAVTSGGGIASGGGGTVAYSVGQLDYTTKTNADVTVAEGVQQAFEIQTVLGVDEHRISLSMQAYPNPTVDYLTLNVGNFDLSTLNFQLYDFGGKLVLAKKITNTTETVQMGNLPAAVYFLKVNSNSREVKIFKIIKE